MNIDKIIAGLPVMSQHERGRVRANAEKLLDSGNAEQKAAATKVIAALGDVEEAEHKALVDRLNGMQVSARVVEAFRVNPMSETEAKIVQVLLDHPGSTSTELSQALGWGGAVLAHAFRHDVREPGDLPLARAEIGSPGRRLL